MGPAGSTKTWAARGVGAWGVAHQSNTSHQRSCDHGITLGALLTPCSPRRCPEGIGPARRRGWAVAQQAPRNTRTACRLRSGTPPGHCAGGQLLASLLAKLHAEYAPWACRSYKAATQPPCRCNKLHETCKEMLACPTPAPAAPERPAAPPRIPLTTISWHTEMHSTPDPLLMVAKAVRQGWAAPLPDGERLAAAVATRSLSEAVVSDSSLVAAKQQGLDTGG